MTFRPMLASPCEDVAALRFPVLVSPKLDGIRCIIRGGVAVSRNLKPIPNIFVQAMLRGLPDGLDGELIVGAPVGNDVWNRSNSGVMSEHGEPHFTFHVFDNCADPSRYAERLAGVNIALAASTRVIPLNHEWARDAEELMRIEDRYVSAGYEGLMIRCPQGPYKLGRSTAREGWLLKLKRFEDHEAVVTGIVERFHNGNEQTRDALGLAKRSTAKAGKVGTGTLGALVCALPNGEAFELGSGFTEAQRVDLWVSPVVGRHVTFKCQGLTPAGKPRFPVFKGFRDPVDLPATSSRLARFL